MSTVIVPSAVPLWAGVWHCSTCNRAIHYTTEDGKPPVHLGETPCESVLCTRLRAIEERLARDAK